MANPAKGEALLRLCDGRQFTLVLDFDGLIEAETTYGKPLNQLLGDLKAGYLGASRAVLLGALKTRHPGVSLREVSAMLLSDSEAVGEALGAAIEAGFPEAKAGADGGAASGDVGGNAPPTQAPTAPASKRSGRSGVKRG